MTTPTDDDLKPFGWAPGHYTIPCACLGDGNRARLDKLGAKRCTRCRECAEAAWREPVEFLDGKDNAQGPRGRMKRPLIAVSTPLTRYDASVGSTFAYEAAGRP